MPHQNNQYMLDTNIVSQLLKGHPTVSRRIVAAPMAALCISAITEAELLFGLAKRPLAKRLHLAVQEFLRRVDTLPWHRPTAKCYGTIRTKLKTHGHPLAPLDLLIASHALSVEAILVTNDQAFKQIAHLQLEDWTSDEL